MIVANCSNIHYLLNSLCMTYVGVYLYLKGELYTNNSHILITEIGQTMDGEEVGGALLCYTDNVECCTSTVRGRWLLPDQTEVGTESEGGAFYVDDRPSVVRLNRRNNDISSPGVFCCEVPDASNVVRRSCVNISEYTRVRCLFTSSKNDEFI